ncbi:MAG: tripartite tricarboxylate transporter TctB family protein, partial [Oscillospiraceae bacterium]
MKKSFDCYASIVFFALGLAIFVYSQTLTKNSFGSSIGPAAMPTLLSFLLMVLSVVAMVKAFRDKAPAKAKKELDYKRFLPFLGALALYVFLLQPLGYVISTFLFMFATFQIMKKGSYLKSTIIADTFSGV